jgi:hypothetical protein
VCRLCIGNDVYVQADGDSEASGDDWEDEEVDTIDVAAATVGERDDEDPPSASDLNGTRLCASYVTTPTREQMILK